MRIQDNMMNWLLEDDNPPVRVEEKDKPSKWITYFALYVLKYIGC
jgi:hypothetical protein